MDNKEKIKINTKGENDETSKHAIKQIKSSLDILEDDLCEAFDCTERATEVIEVPAGVYGSFKLYLCKNCVKNFTKKDEKSK